MMKTLNSVIQIFVGIAFIQSGFSEKIAWFNNPDKVNLDAAGQPMDEQFAFSLGVFANNFTPDPTNINDWLTHWTAAQTTQYNPNTKRFASQYTVTSNPAPFTVGRPGWIFGRRETNGVREWILFRRNTWNWPAPNPLNPFQLDWNVETSNQVVWGEVLTSGTPSLMKAALVPTTYDDWKAIFLAGEANDGPNDDPDLDGETNLIEFVTGHHPLDPLSRPLIKQSIVDGFAVYEIPRISVHPAVLTVEVSENLISWQSGNEHVELLNQTPTQITVKDLTRIVTSPSKKRFARLKVSLPTAP